MCGIAGYLGRRPPSDAAARACLSRMHHRGPDDAGIYRRKLDDAWQVCLLFTRLSVLDLDPRAAQPMLLSEHAIIFNGEIYNYIELRAELAKGGASFKTTGDTEVLLAGLVRGSAAWLDRAEGMWAFAFYAEKDGTLMLSRDRFGEKPLYLMEADEGWYFGSEVKFLAALAGRWPTVNTNHLLRYLVNGYRALYKTDETFFLDVRQIAPGTALVLAPGVSPQEQRYWRPVVAQDETMSYDRAVAGVRERLVESVRLRLRADVPMAFCMSGGVDSNALIAIAKRVFGYDVHGFTVMTKDARYNEEDVVNAVVGELDLKHTAVPISGEGFLENLSFLVRQHDAPVYTISYYLHWLLMQRVAEHGYKIVVSGTAADEIFSGYFDHHNAYLAEMAADGAQHAMALSNWQAYIEPIVRNPYLKDPDIFRRDPSFRDHIYLDAKEFARHLTFEWAEPFSEQCYTQGLLRNRMLNELFHEVVPIILHEDDMNAMSCSIENRSPFLDRSLFEFGNAVPTRHLVRDGRAKAVLRDAMRGIVPDIVLDCRRKVGFNASIKDLLPIEDEASREALLADGPIYDFVKRDVVERLLDEPGLANSRSKFLFNFICASLFLKSYMH
jgi:asparagine synthase (glutamine-hydrolysing)